MATIDDIRTWYERDLARYAKWDDSVQILPPEEHVASRRLNIRIYTDNNCYSIYARDPSPRYRETEPPPMPDYRNSVEPRRETREGMQQAVDAGYLGCGSTSRKPRAGEDWHRGSDLADGPLTEETWHKIIGDIVSYELVRVHRTESRPIDLPAEPPIDPPPRPGSRYG